VRGFFAGRERSRTGSDTIRTVQRIAVRHLVARVDAALQAAGDPVRAETERRYLKTNLRHLGVSVPEIRRAVRRAWPDAGGLPRDELVAAAAALWRGGVHDRRVAAAELLRAGADELTGGDLAFLERLLREARTWALVDVLAPAVVGPVVEREPALGATLDRWASDGDFWLRRAAMLALLPALARGEGDFDRFSRYADAMLEASELFIRRAIGWVLRETARRRPELVYEWLSPRVERMSGTTLREPARVLPADWRQELLSRHPTLSQSRRARESG
jgi:3-methyladenine DNA glycosylase AlkD